MRESAPQLERSSFLLVAELVVVVEPVVVDEPVESKLSQQ